MTFPDYIDSFKEFVVEDFGTAISVAPSEPATLTEVLAEIVEIIPPLWPLADYVAVNPWLGLSDMRFLDARQLLSSVRDCDLLMPREYFQSLLSERCLAHSDIKAAFARCLEEYPEVFKEFDLDELRAALDDSHPSDTAAELRFQTVAGFVDRELGSQWTSHIVNDISRHCGTHFDEGQSGWPSPWRGEPLYAAWHEAAQIGYRMDWLGLKGFRKFVAQLPHEPEAALSELLAQLQIPRIFWRDFLLCELLSVAGWASFARYRVREAETNGRFNEDLVGLLAMRLAYDVALARLPGLPRPLRLCPERPSMDSASCGEESGPLPSPSRDICARYLLQVAAERMYERTLFNRLSERAPSIGRAARPTLQIVFCIDVRSEVMRRNLERAGDAVETFGFAGFFGMPLEYLPLGGTTGPAQCPVLLQPAFTVREALRGADESVQLAATRSRQMQRQGRKIWKMFQTSAISCFSFVESLGVTYFLKMLTDSLGLTRPVPPAHGDGIRRGDQKRLGPEFRSCETSQLSTRTRIDLAEGMLRNLGLTERFARVVALCGHASEVVNNPYKAALDCGACGGHSGEPNARVAAALLNDPKVRSGLTERGISIPADTWFLAALHNTTTDEIRFFDCEELPESHAADFRKIEDWALEAGRLTRIERSARLGGTGGNDLFRRSRDWSETRPEWGLAGNAAFVVAPRSRTCGLDLGGRVFLHSYDQTRDPDLKTLELIMTAPMIVTSWINLQYYASTVDHRAYGSGNKALHNVVGQFGIFQGNGGDLMTGLPWQSIHDGRMLQHEPLRLLVVIEASREAVRHIIDKHSLVRDLVCNGWLSLAVLDAGKCFRFTSVGTWQMAT